MSFTYRERDVVDTDVRAVRFTGYFDEFHDAVLVGYEQGWLGVGPPHSAGWYYCVRLLRLISEGGDRDKVWQRILDICYESL